MSWVLGLFVTDGHVSKNNQSIFFSQKDARILRLIAKYMEADYILAPTGPTKTTPTLIINSKIIKEDLINLGITANKSFTVQFPDVPKEYLPSFIRGIIDGDGHVDKEGYSMNITTGSRQFADQLAAILTEWELTPQIRTFITKSGNTIYRVYLSGKNELIQLAEIIYNHADKDNFLINKRVYMSQHMEKPYYVDDERTVPKWKQTNGKLIHINTSSRISFRTNVSKETLRHFKLIAAERNMYVNHVIEIGLNNLLAQDKYTFMKRTRPKDRVQFKTTYDERLLQRVKAYAKKHRVYINDVIEKSAEFIDG